ncbi:uncharacterized protein EV422DRAFT_154685 [Fimicolochytrium jonesii]|uniref:uncharacterized protein n=1 Tax=Fimicolochytrium jonesii TaxID=1396493 RepID=UPI0022FE397A|nr:uncharacterized protein EV422DRAFT_154685 [Fimicolochytrium jonesii]KAI8826114.1 hypothetical protein EV422DRAFT_154685 [Fimicolochytrium jonesii]
MRQNDLTNARKATRKALEVLNGQDNPRGLFWRYNEMKRTTTTYQGGRRTGQTKEYFPMAELEVMPIPSFSLSGMDDAVFTPPMASMSPRVGTVSQSEFAAPYAYQQAPLTGTSMAPRTQPAAAFAAPARPASSAISMSSVPGPSRLPPTSTRQYLTSSPSANERESHGSSANPFTDDANLADEYDPEAPPPAYDSFSRPSRPAQQSSKRGKF